MNGIDWIIVGLVLVFALYGWAQGFVVGLLSLGGFVLGAFIGTRVGPLLLTEGSKSPYAPLFGVVGAVVAGAILAAGFEGFGQWIRQAIDFPGLRAIDGVLGSVLTGCVALAIAWLLGAVMIQAPQLRDLRRDLQRSAILQRLNTILPPSGPILNALARLDPFPEVQGGTPDVPEPRAAIARDPDVQAAQTGVVKILGTACGLGIEGSGWIARPGVVVTNAHVIAGQHDTVVLLQGHEPRLRAVAIHFDTRNDLAILRVDGLGGRTLPLAAAARRGASAAVLGFPENGPYDVRAARVGDTSEVLADDAYGNGPFRRSLLSLRGLVRQGNSGGPLVDARGRVAGTIFAATVSGPRGGYAVPNAITRDALAALGGPVDTGPCTD